MDKSQFYNNPAAILSDEELKMMIGTLVCVEHDPKRVIGEVTYAQTDADGKIQIEWRKIEGADSGRSGEAAFGAPGIE